MTREYRKLEGQRFGFVEVIKKNGVQGNNVLWLCKCHACGKEFNRTAGTIRKSTKSCGCKRRHRGNKSPHWRGVGEMSSSIVGHYRVNAVRRGIEFDITPKEMWDLYVAQNRKCALSELPIVFGRTGREENTASLDRIDSSLSYKIGNVQWVHKHINAMKLNHDQSYFINLCTIISHNQNRI